MKKLYIFLVVSLSFLGKLCPYLYDVKNDAKGLLFIGFYGGAAGSKKVGEVILQPGEKRRFDSGNECVTHLYIKGEAGGSLAGLEQDYYSVMSREAWNKGGMPCFDLSFVISRPTINPREKSTSFVVVLGPPKPFIVSEKPL